ncbi:sensor histidine kinase [Spirosoma arcticum]
MKPAFADSAASLPRLVSFLATQHKSILENWRIACDQDPLLRDVTDLSQVDFNDGLPKILTILQQRLSGQPQEASIDQIAIAHGLQRQHKARLVVETVQELNHLTQALYSELAHFQERYPSTDSQLFWFIQQHMTQIMTELVNGVVKIYDQLQRSEAANRMAVLQKMLDQINALLQERSGRLRNSMHDLGGGIGIINAAANLLQLEELSEQDRTVYLDMLNRNLIGVGVMLTNLMDLSRLEAGQERLQIQPIDAARLLKEMVNSVQPLAKEQGLVVRANGPDSLLVETDAVKLQRIIQNLLLNALKYTPTGFIDISWAEQDGKQWMFEIQDSGPGLPIQVVTRLRGHLKPGVNPFASLEPEPHEPATLVAGATDEQVPDLALEKSAHESSEGEGIGLTIVKEFSQLLGATLEVEAAPGQGTSFRLWLPIRYSV